jgi:hypothetical protein
MSSGRLQESTDEVGAAVQVEKYARYKNKEKRKAYLKEYQREYMRAYRRRRAEEGRPIRSNSRNYYKNLRKKALEILGGLRCEECGCDNYRVLEINHIKGGGRQDMLRESKADSFYRSIIKGTRDNRDYNVLCRVCNAKHYVESLLGIKGHVVVWNCTYPYT